MESTVKTPLNQAQMLVLQAIKEQHNEQYLDELHQLLIDFNNRKMQEHLDETISKKGYTDQDFAEMLKGHYRKAY